MKKLKLTLAILVIAILFTLFLIPIVNAEEVTVVKAGAGTLQQAVQNAKSGDILKLEAGSYSGDDITIDKDITIRGAGTDYAKGSCVRVNFIIENEESQNNLKVNLQDFYTTTMVGQDSNITFINVKSKTDLNLSNLSMSYATRPEGYAVFLYVEKTADASNIEISKSSFIGSYDGIRIESSDTTLTMTESKVAGSVAIELKEGSNNKVNVKNSELDGGRYFTSIGVEEAVTIIGQQNLKLNIEDSKLIANSVLSTSKVATHLISFQDYDIMEFEDEQEGVVDETAPKSTGVEVRITGNSELISKNINANGDIINFSSCEPNDNNVIYIDKDVIIKNAITMDTSGSGEYRLSNVEDKYNKANKYLVVGIYDPQGNLTVKQYNKNAVIPEGDLTSKLEGYSLESWYKTTGVAYKPARTSEDTTITESTTTGYEEPYKFNVGNALTENIDLYPLVATSKVNVKLGERTFEVEVNKTFGDLKSENQEFAALIEELMNVENKTFYEFVIDGEIQVQIKDEDKITNDITIIPKYTVNIKIGEKTFELDEGKTFADLKEKNTENEEFTEIIDSMMNNPDKHFSKFVKIEDEDRNAVLDDTVFNNHTTLIPVYTITITVQVKNGETVTNKEFTTDEGTKLTEFKAQNAENEEFTAIVEPEGKTFDYFKNSEGNKLEDTYVLNSNLTIIPKYNVTITIESKLLSESKEVVIDEGTSLEDSEEIMNILEPLTNVEGKQSVILNSQDEIVDTTAVINEHTKIVVANYVFGDIDDDGKINASDARLALLAFAERQELSKVQKLAGDVDGNGSINASDARDILLFFAERLDKFEVEK